jgi:hypothetical protein
MKNWFYAFMVLCGCINQSGQAQNFSSLWQSHFSYNRVVDVVTGDGKIYAAAENAIFEYVPDSDELRTITTVEGLSGGQITTIYFSDIYGYLLIGYENGLIEIYTPSEDSVLTVVDILERDNITPVNKRINHFFEHQGLVYISTNYGVSVYNLQTLEFGDTYFLGDGGQQIQVNQVAVVENTIYVACLDGNGLKVADLSNPNLIDFTQWQTLVSGNFVNVNVFNGKAYAVRLNRALFEIEGAVFNQILVLDTLPLDSETSPNNLIYSTADALYLYNSALVLENILTPNTDFETSFTSAARLNGVTYVGTIDFGVLSTLFSDTDYYEIRPNGPLFNQAFKINAETGIVWATFGDYTPAFDPSPNRTRGISYLDDGQWNTIPFDSLFNARNLNTISVNPFIENQVLISSFQDGILELNNFEPTVLYDESNSGLESLILPNNPNVVSVRVFSLNIRFQRCLMVHVCQSSQPFKIL